jgi:hypothetical protein
MFSFFKRNKEGILVTENTLFGSNQGATAIVKDNFTTVPEVRGKRIVLNDKNQESRVESIIRENGNGMTPYEVLEAYEKLYDSVPITSIRRAMTKLTDHGILNMTGEKKMGRYNQPNFIWSLKNVINEQIN